MEATSRKEPCQDCAYLNCCDCGIRDNGVDDTRGCGCRYCWSCNCCDELMMRLEG